MKTKIYSLLAILTLSITAWSQGVGINETGANPDPSAMLDVESTDKGFLPPRMTSAQRNAISNPAKGLMVYNADLSCLQVNDGTPASPVWNCISNQGGVPDGFIATINCAGATNNGTLVQGIVSSGVNSIIPYTGGNFGVHSGQVVTSTGVTGLTATLSSGQFANGAGSLTYNITGTPGGSGTASFAINIGGQTCTLSRTVLASLPNICNPSNPTVIADVTNGTTGKTWMDRNLGAHRAATSSTDIQSYGSLYQWGRGSDGHQCVNRRVWDDVTTSGTTSTLSSSDTPGHGNFILTPSTPFDWRSPQNNNLWQGVNGTNNPCPSGYRLPSQTELNQERTSWSSSNLAGAFASPLKLSAGGNRNQSDGNIFSLNTGGFYWSSTITTFSSNASYLYIYSGNSDVNTNARGLGYSVRCIKN